MIGDVQTRLFGEPGLVDVQPGWTQLRDAADALQAVCGQGMLLTQPTIDSPAIAAAQRNAGEGAETAQLIRLGLKELAK